MNTTRLFFFAFFTAFTLLASAVNAADYDELQNQAQELRSSTRSNDDLRIAIETLVVELSKHWLGTTWGLGRPQSSTPQKGKINCGTFVGTLLVHAGFNVNYKKLQRQPAELIIKTFAGKHDIKRFRNASVKAFVAGVGEMGNGLYILGLDYHVGLLYVQGDSVRFIHANYYSEDVVDEDAATSPAIADSRYRVVGRVLSAATLAKWKSGSRIDVKGNW